MNTNRSVARAQLRPLASIPNKDGFTIIGVRRDGAEAKLTVYFDQKAGIHRVPGYDDLVGWKLP